MFKCPKKASSSPCQTMRMSLVFPAALQTINLHQRKSAPKLYSLAGCGGRIMAKQQKTAKILKYFRVSPSLHHLTSLMMVKWTSLSEFSMGLPMQREKGHTWLRGQDMLQFRPKLQINLWRDCMWHSLLRTFHLPSMTQFTMCSLQ